MLLNNIFSFMTSTVLYYLDIFLVLKRRCVFCALFLRTNLIPHLNTYYLHLSGKRAFKTTRIASTLRPLRINHDYDKITKLGLAGEHVRWTQVLFSCLSRLLTAYHWNIGTNIIVTNIGCDYKR